MREQDIEVYQRAYEAPGAMRAGSKSRNFQRDHEDNIGFLRAFGKIRTPVLAIAGQHSFTCPRMEAMVKEVAQDVTFTIAPGAGHWVPEERPDFTADQITAFLNHLPN